jgi:hypothetical protein
VSALNYIRLKEAYSLPASSCRPLFAVHVCLQGIQLWKLPRSTWSSPTKTKFYIFKGDGKYALKWDSKSKGSGEDTIYLSKKDTFYEGFLTGLWKSTPSYREKFSQYEKSGAFSIGTPARSLDLCSESHAEYEYMALVLRKICSVTRG